MSENRYNGSWLVARGSWLVARAIKFTSYKLLRLYQKTFRYLFIIRPSKRRLKNTNFSIISKDCTGAVMLHELGLKFNSPTVNLWFTAGDFTKFCTNLKYYISQELTEHFEAGKNYPIGTLGEGDNRIKIYFMHYENFSQAKSKWDERKKRINWDNLYFIMTDGEGCDERIAKEFDSLPYEHKALLTYRELDGVKSAVKFNITMNKDRYGIGQPEIFAYKSKYSLKRVIDEWDYIKFLNS